MNTKPCPCGSGLAPRRLYDARGLYVSRACDDCEARVKARYRPEIFTDPRYETDEPINEPA